MYSEFECFRAFRKNTIQHIDQPQTKRTESQTIISICIYIRFLFADASNRDEILYFLKDNAVKNQIGAYRL